MRTGRFAIYHFRIINVWIKKAETSVTRKPTLLLFHIELLTPLKNRPFQVSVQAALQAMHHGGRRDPAVGFKLIMDAAYSRSQGSC